ncbi:hypothetical protein ACFU99_35160 [Streptomyces sp. NPDC057654]|uniref:hypothetical protein n=1 Tax=Streptomyces sp. NPDC057654 TaxID=3346196 RepID=UPI0036A0B61F
MKSRAVAATTAVVLVLEAIGIAFLNWFLGLVVDKQGMSLAGLDPHAMTVGAWAAGAVFALYLLLCAFALARTAWRDRAPGIFLRIVLITCAVVHALLGAFAVGLVGWFAFALMMVVLGLIVLSLVLYDREPDAESPDTRPTKAGNPHPA